MVPIFFIVDLKITKRFEGSSIYAVRDSMIHVRVQSMEKQSFWIIVMPVKRWKYPLNPCISLLFQKCFSKLQTEFFWSKSSVLIWNVYDIEIDELWGGSEGATARCGSRAVVDAAAMIVFLR